MEAVSATLDPICHSFEPLLMVFHGFRSRQKAEKRIGLTGKEVQLEVWARENRFEKLMREASRLAKRRQRSVDLFNYFERAYK